jgi:DNA helicase-2/ATP-dependent DNA helicase PcrA
MKDVFAKKYQDLNLEQKEAVDYIHGPIMVIAGPGTGKTSVLVLRIANILKSTDIRADSILALTFTESGVKSMREKLSQVIGPEAYRVSIYTFHGFANLLIKENPEKFPRIIGARNAEELERAKLMQEAINLSNAKILKPRNDPAYYVKPCLNAIKDLKREGITTSDFKDLINDQRKSFEQSSDNYHKQGKYKGELKGAAERKLERIEKNNELYRVYSAYEKLLEENRLYDFEDMIMEALKVLRKDRALRMSLQEEYQYILADEHQDTNRAQNMILEVLASGVEQPNLFIVGDEKQAIFRFQGASLENFLYFKRLFPEAKLVTLEKNYRSHQTILDASHALIQSGLGEDRSLRKALIAAGAKKREKIKVCAVSDKPGERRFVAEQIKKEIRNGEKSENIAVLVRENKDAQGIEEALKDLGIKVSRYADSDALSSPRINALISLFNACVHPSDENIANVIFFDYLNLPYEDVFLAIEKFRREKKRSLLRVLADFDTLVEFSRSIYKWGRYARNEYALQALSMIAEESGFIKNIFSLGDKNKIISSYDALLRSAEKFAETEKSATLFHFISYINESREHGIQIKEEVSSPEGVSIMTAHGAKGLEFESVYILHVNDGVWGGKRKRSLFDLPIAGGEENHDLDDERRLFYVALTRAKSKTTISYHINDESGAKKLPSIFIEEIPEEYKKFEFVKAPLRTFGTKAKEKKLLEDKDYLRTLFLSRGFSVTHFNNYLSCPWRYFFIDLVRIPKIRNASLIYGEAVHAGLKAYFDNLKNGKSGGGKIALYIFERVLTNSHLNEKEIKAFLKAGKEALKNYLKIREVYKPLYAEYDIGGIKFDFNSGSNSIELKGKLDKVLQKEGNRVEVVDYKTGKAKSRREIEGLTKGSDGNYMRQLLFYKFLLEREGKWNMETGRIDFVESFANKKGGVSEVFFIEKQNVEAMEKLLQTTIEKIYAMNFKGEICKDRDCEYCELGNFLTN